jgi:hypothetical protein
MIITATVSIPYSVAQSVQDVHKAMIGNVTLGKEIQADPTRLQQLLQDTKQYESDSQNAIINANDIRILHDMCSYAAANPTIPMSMIAPDCNQTVTTK